MSEWWTKELTSLFPLPSGNDFNSFLISNFGLIKHNNIYMENFYFKDLTPNNIMLNDLQCIDYGDEIKKININHNNNVNKINNNNDLIDKKKQTKIKTLKPKKIKQLMKLIQLLKKEKMKFILTKNKLKYLINGLENVIRFIIHVFIYIIMIKNLLNHQVFMIK